MMIIINPVITCSYTLIHNYKVNKPDSDIIMIKVYGRDQCRGQCSGQCSGPFLEETSVKLEYRCLNKATVDLSDIPPDYIEPDPNYYGENYQKILDYYKNQIKLPGYPRKDPNIFLPYGDMDSNFPEEGDYDGDQICNLYEIVCHNSLPHYPTFPLSLHKGINLYYFPSIDEWSYIILRDQIQLYHYINSSKTWQCEENLTIKSNTFNAIYTPYGEMLSLELIVPNHPVFCLRGPLYPNYLHKQDPNGILATKIIREYLNEHEVWSRFIHIDETKDPNFPKLIWNPGEIVDKIGSAALITGDPNRLGLLVDDISTDTNNYKTKRVDAITYFPSISVALFSYAIVPNKITIELPAGWSLISLPVIPNNTVLSDLFPYAEVVYGYDIAEGYFRVKNQEELQVRRGYWVLLDTNQSYERTGQPILSYSLPMHENGWEMIAGISFQAHASIDNGTIEVVYRYVPGTGYQQVLDSEDLEPGKGYWILVNGISN